MRIPVNENAGKTSPRRGFLFRANVIFAPHIFPVAGLNAAGPYPEKMNIQIHTVNETKIGEVIADEQVLTSLDDAMDLMGNLYYQGADSIILHEKAITPAFFDLKSKLAGDILQKFSNYRMRLAIVGDFAKYPGKSFQAFVKESNKGRQVNFVPSRQEAFRMLSER